MNGDGRKGAGSVLTMLRWTGVAALSVPAVILASFAWTQPDAFSRRFLRTGGRIVKEMADHPARVAAFLAVCVVVLWVIIGVRCGWEAWRERPNSQKDTSRAVANR